MATRVGLDAKSEGVLVKSVDSGASVSESELEKDDIILKVNGVFTPTVVAYKKVIASLRHGDVMRIVYAGKRLTQETGKRVTVFTID